MHTKIDEYAKVWTSSQGTDGKGVPIFGMEVIRILWRRKGVWGLEKNSLRTHLYTRPDYLVGICD